MVGRDNGQCNHKANGVFYFGDQNKLSVCQSVLDKICGDCLRRSRNGQFCQSLNKEISLEKKRENTLILNEIKVNFDTTIGKIFLSVTYPLKCYPHL